jgi:hypothetical protein
MVAVMPALGVALAMPTMNVVAATPGVSAN